MFQKLNDQPQGSGRQAENTCRSFETTSNELSSDDTDNTALRSPVSRLLYQVGHEMFQAEDEAATVPQVDVVRSNTSQRRSARKSVDLRKSPVWKYFVPGSGSAKCKLCQKWIKRTGGNTSNLTAHLRSYHREQFDAVIEEAAHRKTEATAVKLV